MPQREFPKFGLFGRRRTPAEIARGARFDAPAPTQQRWTFTRIWIACLPLSIGAICGSILLSGGDPDRRPFLVFGIGLILGVIGLASLFAGLIQAGNVERARRRARDAARAKQDVDAGRKDT